MGIFSKGMLKKALKMPETRPALRRYFVNTIFDTTFVILGVIIGSALSPHPSIDVVKTTIITSSVALAISTGASVYEAESLEQSRRLDEISRAMLSSVDETDLGSLDHFGHLHPVRHWLFHGTHGEPQPLDQGLTHGGHWSDRLWHLLLDRSRRLEMTISN